MGRLNSKYYRYRAEQNALNNVQPRTASGGIFSRNYDKPSDGSGGLIGMVHRRREARWKGEQRHMQRSDYAKRAVDFARRNPAPVGVYKPFVKPKKVYTGFSRSPPPSFLSGADVRSAKKHGFYSVKPLKTPGNYKKSGFRRIGKSTFLYEGKKK